MKKYILLFATAVVLISCLGDDIDENGPFRDFAQENATLQAYLKTAPSSDGFRLGVQVNMISEVPVTGMKVTVGYKMRTESGGYVSERTATDKEKYFFEISLERLSEFDENIILTPTARFYKITTKNYKDLGAGYYTYEEELVGEYLLEGESINLGRLDLTGETVVVDSIAPKEAFVGDEVKIYGKNFCVFGLNQEVSTSFYIGGYNHSLEFEDNDVLVTTLSSEIVDASSSIRLMNCGFNLFVDDKIKLKEHRIDSISSGLFYPEDTLVIYGDNFNAYSYNQESKAKVFIDNKEASVLIDTTRTYLQCVVPNKLPKGVLDVRVTQFGLEKKIQSVFKSTTPTIESLDKANIGLNDTVLVRGYFFKEKRNAIPKVIIGVEQDVLSYNDSIIEFHINNPRIGSHDNRIEIQIDDEVSVYENIEFVKPKVISFDKLSYDINDTIKIKTVNFLPKISSGEEHGYSYGNLPAGVRGGGGRSFFDADEELLTLYTSTFKDNFYSEGDYYHSEGKVNFSLVTDFGSTSIGININPPVVSEIYIDDQDSSSYYYGSLVVKGKNFGFHDIDGTIVRVDGEEILFNISSHVRYNELISLPVYDLEYGKHIVEIEVAGQSTSAEFEIKADVVESIYPLEGNRNTVFTIKGSGFSNIPPTISVENDKGSYSNCSIISYTDNEIQFKINYGNTYLTNKEYGVILRQYASKQELPSIKLTDYYGYTESFLERGVSFVPKMRNLYVFEYDDEMYSVSPDGTTIKYNNVNNTWEFYDKLPDDIVVDSNPYIQGDILNGIFFISHKKGFYKYDIQNKTNEKRDVVLPYSKDMVYNTFYYRGDQYLVIGYDFSFSYDSNLSEEEKSFRLYKLKNNKLEFLFNLGEHSIDYRIVLDSDKIFIIGNNSNAGYVGSNNNNGAITSISTVDDVITEYAGSLNLGSHFSYKAVTVQGEEVYFFRDNSVGVYNLKNNTIEYRNAPPVSYYGVVLKKDNYFLVIGDDQYRYYEYSTGYPKRMLKYYNEKDL